MKVIAPPSSSLATEVATVSPALLLSSVNGPNGVTTSTTGSLAVVVFAGLTTTLVVEVSPVVLAAVTLKSGKSLPAFTIDAPAAVRVTVPVVPSIA